MKRSLLFLFFSVINFVGFSQTYTVTNTNDAGVGSLRNGIIAVNAGTATRIEFKTGAVTTDSIKLKSRLPIITKPIDIDATTEQNYNPLTGPKIALVYDSLKFVMLTYPNSGQDVCGRTQYVGFGEFSGLYMNTSNSFIKGLLFFGFTTGVEFLNKSNYNEISSNVIVNSIRKGFWINGDNNNIENNLFGIDFNGNVYPNGGAISLLMLQNFGPLCSEGGPLNYPYADSLSIKIEGNFNKIVNNNFNSNITRDKPGVVIIGNNIDFLNNKIFSPKYNKRPGWDGAGLIQGTNIQFYNSSFVNLTGNQFSIGSISYSSEVSFNYCQKLKIKNNVFNANGIFVNGSNYNVFDSNIFNNGAGFSINFSSSNNNHIINNNFFKSGIGYMGYLTSQIVNTNSLYNNISHNYYGNLGIGMGGVHATPISGAVIPSPTISQNSFKDAPIFKLYGSSSPLDTIELYSKIDSASAIRFKYIGRTLADASGNWIISLSSGFRSDTINLFSAIAISNQGSTSDFGNIYSVCPSCACVVTNVDDSGVGSLRDAISCANNKYGRDSIVFNIPDVLKDVNGQFSINLLSGIRITDAISLNGLVENGKKLIHIKGTGFSLNEYTGNNLISNLEFSNMSSAISSFSADILIRNNFIHKVQNSAVNLGGEGNWKIYSNVIDTCSIGIMGLVAGEVKIGDSNVGNRISNASIASISFVESAFTNILINNNILSYNRKGIDIDNCRNVSISDNEIINSAEDGIFTGTGIIQIRNNFIGITKNMQPAGNGGNGISGWPNTNSIIFGNTIAYNINGINLGNGLDIIDKISQNQFLNNSLKAIELNGTTLYPGNNNHLSPYNLTSSQNIVSGKATPNDTVEVFLSDGKPQNAIQYLGYAIAKGDSSWTYTLPVSIFADSSIAHIVTTGTDVLGNTSELSGSLKITYCPTCPCEVTTTDDNGDNNNPIPGSLRAAILCANTKTEKTEIKFKLVGTAPFTFTPSGLPPILNPYGVIIDGNSQTDNVAVNEKKIIIKTATLFLPQTGPSDISNIEFQDQVFGVMSFSDSLTVNGCKFKNNSTGVYVSTSGKDFKIYNNNFEGGTYAVSVSNAKNVLVDNNQYLNVANAINFQTVDSSTISNNNIYGITGTCINLSSSTKNITVQNTNIVNAASSVYGVNMQSVENVLINKYKQIGGQSGVTYSGKNIAVKNSYFKNVKNGIAYGTQSTVLSIQNDTIINSETGIFISNYVTTPIDVLIENCVIDSCSISGIEMASNQGGLTNGIVQNNKITRFLKYGINIGQGNNNLYQYNEIGNGIGSAFKWPRGNSNTKINNNFIGVDKSGVAMPIKGIGIDISSQTNQGVGTSCIIVGNIICNIDSTNNSVEEYSGSGIVLGSGTEGISILNNSIGLNGLHQVTPVKKPLYLFWASVNKVRISQNKLVAFSGQKPINLNAIANNNKPSPKALNSSFNSNLYSFKGKAYPGDTIEVFISNALVTAATSFVAQGIALSDSSFTITLPDSILNKGDFYVAATARDILGNTSELSNSLKIYCQSCLCEVTTTDDNGDNNNPTPGSLRAAILCANAKVSKAEIKFKLVGAGPYLFNPSVAYVPILNNYGVVIDGNSQTKSTAADTIVINGSLFLPKVGPSKIANLSFGGVSGGLTCYSDSIVISDCHFSQGNGLFLKLDNSQRLKDHSRLAVTQASAISISSTTFNNTKVSLNNINGASITSNNFINGNTNLFIDNQSENIVISKNTFINLQSTALSLYSKSTVIDGNKIIYNDTTQTGVVAGTCGTDVTISNHYQKGGSVGITYTANLTLKNSKFVNVKNDVLFSASMCGKLTMAFDTLVNTKRGASLDNIQKVENCIFDSISVLALGRSQFAKTGAVIQNNTFTRIVGDAIYLHRPQFDTIQNNVIEGVLNSGSTSHHGIYVLSPGFSGNNVRIFKNKFYNFDSGIDFGGEEQNKFSQNLFHNISTKAIVLQPTRTNKLKPAPDSLSFTYNNNYLFNGKSYPGDTIEVFLSNYKGTDATSYVAIGVTATDSTFAIVIPDSVLAKELFFLAATATDVLGNTSELSAPLKICITCECVVENTNPSGAGSLFEAINCANKKPTRAKIIFAIPGEGPYLINQTSPLPAFNNPLGIVINGLSQDTAAVGSGNQSITIQGSDLALNQGKNDISHINFRNSDINVKSSDNQLSYLTLKQASYAVKIFTNATNNSIDNCNIDTATYGVHSDGTFTKINHSTFKNLQYGVFLFTENGNLSIKNSSIENVNFGVYTNRDNGNNTVDSVVIKNVNNFGLYFRESSVNTFKNLIIESAAISEKGISLFQSTNSTIINSKILYFNEGIWIQDCNQSTISKNIIVGKNELTGTGITSRSFNTIINSNVISKSSQGIKFFGPTANICKFNIIGNVDNAIVDQGTDNVVSNNYLGLDSLGNNLPIVKSAIEVGISGCEYKNNVIGNVNTGFLLQSYVLNTKIIENYIGQSKTGISVPIAKVAIKAVHLNTPLTNSIISDNIINNADSALSLYTATADIISNNSIGYNIIGSKVNVGFSINNYNAITVLNNDFNSTIGDAIQLMNTSAIRLTKNTFINTSAKAINLNLANANESNLGKPAPTILYSLVNPTNWTLSGKSAPGDTVEVFNGAVNEQVASKYIGYAIAGSDSMWTATLSLVDLDQAQKSFFVTTATDNLKNTSELSKPYGFCETCVCLVINTSNTGGGSLRDAVTKGNNGDCSKIRFDITPISSEYKINLDTELPTIIRPLNIDGTSQVGYDATKTPIVQLNPQTQGAFNGINSNYYFVSIKGLYFNGFDTGVLINGKNSTISHSVFGNSKNANVTIKGESNTLSNSFIGVNLEGQALTNTSVGVLVNGVNNFVVSNTISKNGTHAIEVNTLVGNQLLNNLMYDNGVDDNIQSYAIVLSNDGNKSKLAPTFTGNQVTASSITITGKAIAGDKVQLFTNNNLPEETINFIAEATTDNSNNWSITVPSSFIIQGQNNYFVATATSASVGTSVLSNVYQVGAYPVSCYVTNVKNSGKGSLRAAVACVNNAGTGQGLAAQIIFSLPTSPMNTIDVMSDGFDITNNIGVSIDAKAIPVQLVAKSGADYAFNWLTQKVNIANLTFNDFPVAINTTGNIANISSNKFVNNVIAIKANGGKLLKVASNTIDGGNIGIWANSLKGQILNNTIGNTTKPNGLGILVEKCDSIFVLNNTIKGVNAGTLVGLDVNYSNKGIVLSEISHGFINTNILTVSALSSGIYIDKSINSQVQNNQISNGAKGIEVVDSKNLILTRNSTNDVTVAGIYLNKTENTTLTQNVAIGLTATSKPIELLYSTINVSNKAKKVPEFKFATYKKKTLYIHGKSEPGDLVEIFETDGDGWNLKSHLSSVLTDNYGNFVYSFNVVPTDINTHNFKATATVNEYGLGNDKVYTSEASAKFNPNLKLCFVTNNLDAGKGSLRAAIDTANADRCNLMLFELSVGQFDISPNTPLQSITAPLLTIDATSQDGYSNQPVVYVTDKSFKSAFDVNTNGDLFIHGIGLTGYDNPITINKVREFEQSLNSVNDFKLSAIDFISTKHKSIVLDSNVYTSTTAKNAFVVNKPHVMIKDNKINAGLDTSILITADSLLIMNNTISYPTLLTNSTAITITNTDSVTVKGNKISQYGNGIFANYAHKLIVIANSLDTVISFAGYNRAIYVNHSDYVKVFSNKITRSDSAITIDTSLHVNVAGNYVDSCRTNGIHIRDSEKTLVSSNSVFRVQNGVLVTRSFASKIVKNTLYRHQLAGLSVDSLSDSLKIQDNTIGASFTESTSKSKGAGIILKSNLNEIGPDTSLGNNILNNTLGGILVYGKNNKITGNRIFDNDTSITTPVHFAIEHFRDGNELKLKPIIDSFNTVIKNKQFIIYGTAEANDTVHIYRADGVYQNAKYYINKVIADAKGQWSVNITITDLKPKLDLMTLTVVATATNATNNTSQLSNMLYVGACYIANNLDKFNNVYPLANTFRQAVQCANSQAENVDIFFAIEQNSTQPIYLEGKMIDLRNTYGVNFDAKNLKGAKTNTKIGFGAIGANNRFSTFWKIDTLAGPSLFKNLEVSNFDTALVMNTKRDITLRNFKFTVIEKNALVLGKGVKKYILDSLTFDAAPNATFISARNNVNMINIKNSSFKLGNSAINLDTASDISIDNNKFALCKYTLDLTNIDSLKLSKNTFKTESVLKVVGLDKVKGLASENSFEGNTGLNLFEISNSSILQIDKTSQKDSCLSVFNIVSSDSIKVTNSAINNVNKFIKVNNSTKVYIIGNKIAKSTLAAFDITSSETVKMTKNILEDTKDTITKPINIHRSSASQSNENKPDPIILGYNLKKIIEGDCIADTTRLGIFLYGKAAPKDTIEIYFTDSLKYTLKEVIKVGVANASGDWDIRIPREKYIKEANKWYHIVVTATTPSNKTSQISNKLNFGRVVNQIKVKYSNNEGALTLRDAIDKINCSDVRSRVSFEMDSLKNHVITLLDSLPKINAYMGFEMDGTTQKHYADSLKLAFPNQTITVNSSLITVKEPVFNILAKSDSSIVKSMSFQDCKSVLKLGNELNTLDSLHISFTKTPTLMGDTAIKMNTAKENTFKNSSIRGYKVGTYFSDTSNGNKCVNDTIDAKVAYIFNKGAKANLVDKNIINTDSISIVYNYADALNLVKYSTFGSVTNPIKYPAFYLLNSSNQYIINNFMPLANITDANADKAFMVVQGKSTSNLFSANKMGVDREHTYTSMSNTKGIWLRPKPKSIDSIPINNTLVANEIVGLSLQGIQLDTVGVTNINNNYIGVDSIFKSKGVGSLDYTLVPGTSEAGILITKSSYVSINNNIIVNYGTYGIDARSSADLNMDKNKIFSEKTTNKAINLNNLDPLLASNKNKFAPNDTIAAPIFTGDDIEGVSKLTLTGTSNYPNATINIFEAFDNAPIVPNDDLSQALRFVKATQTNSTGDWSVDLTTANFGFTKYNKYVAQLTYQNQSSELSQNYRLQPLLCKLVERNADADPNNNIDLIAPKYEPCPKSQFKVDATLEGLNYAWTSTMFPTITTQVAQIDTNAMVTLTMTDDISNCELIETFEVAYKPRAAQPEFIVSSDIYVGDTISLVDISINKLAPTDYDWSSSALVNIVPIKGDISAPIIGPDGKTYSGGRELRFTVPDTGKYIITQRTLRDGCFISVDKEIVAKYKDPGVTNPYVLAPTVESLVVYPVPSPQGQDANTFLKVSTKDPIYLSVVNSQGTEVYSTVISGSLNYNVPLPISSFKSGVYIVRLETELETLSYKFVIIAKE